MTAREPVLNPVKIETLRPTQITVGYKEVSEKLSRWRAKAGDQEASYLGRHMIPVVKGPKDRSYVLDHHHLCRALLEAGQSDILVNVVADLSNLSKDEFWVFMDNRSWCHPYDAQGRRLEFKAIPKTVSDLSDDPYRSLAGELRRAGGYSKNEAPFAEFIWADFMRRRIKTSLVVEHFEQALQTALKLAREPEARHLPGWCGPDEDA